MNTVAVIIPNYNGKKYIADCLNSLKKQTFKDFCVIIVDNASTDGSPDQVEKDFADSFPEVRIIRLSENTGFANAVNVGIRYAMGQEDIAESGSAKYVFLLNNDTRCHEKAIEALVKAMDSNPGAFSVQAKMLQFKDTDRVDDAGDYYCALGWAFSPARDQKSSKFDKRIKVTSACGGAAMYRVEAFAETGLFDDVHFCYLEDVDIGYRARLMGYQNLMEPKAVVYHAGSGSSGSRYNAFKVELTASNNLYLIYKNMPILQVLINLPLVITGILIKHIFYMKRGLGGAHIKGLTLGFSKIFKNSDRKVRFGGRQILNCIRMQLELWINCLRLGRFL
ncbi:MAG: glycosyltransferase family 2 protein [Butyrivibrio sp.]|nr:glycosyltransferase family 2 protein [Butyrivibrio sp.]